VSCLFIHERVLACLSNVNREGFRLFAALPYQTFTSPGRAHAPRSVKPAEGLHIRNFAWIRATSDGLAIRVISRSVLYGFHCGSECRVPSHRPRVWRRWWTASCRVSRQQSTTLLPLLATPSVSLNLIISCGADGSLRGGARQFFYDAFSPKRSGTRVRIRLAILPIRQSAAPDVCPPAPKSRLDLATSAGRERPMDTNYGNFAHWVKLYALGMTAAQIDAVFRQRAGRGRASGAINVGRAIGPPVLSWLTRKPSTERHSDRGYCCSVPRFLTGPPVMEPIWHRCASPALVPNCEGSQWWPGTMPSSGSFVRCPPERSP